MGTLNWTFSSFSPSPLSLPTYFPSEYLPLFLSSRNSAISVLSFPVLHPCSPVTQLLVEGGCVGYIICPSRSHFHPSAQCLCQGRPALPSGSWLGWVPQSMVGEGGRRWGSLLPSPQGFSSCLVALPPTTILPPGSSNHYPLPLQAVPLQVIITPHPCWPP